MDRLLRLAVGVFGIALLALGVLDRNYQSLAIAGSILYASIIVSGKPIA